MNDTPRDSLSVEDVFLNAPECEGNLFRVPIGDETYTDNFELDDLDVKKEVDDIKEMLDDGMTKFLERRK